VLAPVEFFAGKGDRKLRLLESLQPLCECNKYASTLFAVKFSFEFYVPLIRHSSRSGENVIPSDRDLVSATISFDRFFYEILCSSLYEYFASKHECSEDHLNASYTDVLNPNLAYLMTDLFDI
jgi:hypothetical protein